MRKDGGAEYAVVRGLTRGLDLLKALNTQEGGRSTLAQLSEATGLHRTTVRRLLETLIAEGYVRRSRSDDRYVLALHVRSLSEGFRDEDWIASIAAPALGELLQTVVWPSDLATPQGAEMIIRESTHRFSPLSFHRAMVGQTMPTLLAADDRFVANIIARTRYAGYASNDGEWTSHRKIGAIAQPVMHAGRPVGSINIVYLNKAVSLKEAISRYLPALQKAVTRIEAQFADHPPPPPQAG